MDVTKIVGAYICWLLMTISPAQGQGWRGIVPLHSTRQDVERLIGSPVMPGGITYDLKTERVNVGYSHGGCEKGEEWNVPPGTVTNIRIYPQTKVMLSDLEIDVSRFNKFIDPHVGDSVIYSNKEEGIAVRLTSNSEVESIQYSPRTKDDDLRCPGFSTRPLSNDELQYFTFDEYPKLSLSDERARLDNFAAQLRRESKSKAYILAYAGPSRRSRGASHEVLARAKRARAYLSQRWRMDTSRVEVRFAGHRASAMWQLCLVPEGVRGSSSKP